MKRNLPLGVLAGVLVGCWILLWATGDMVTESECQVREDAARRQAILKIIRGSEGSSTYPVVICGDDVRTPWPCRQWEFSAREVGDE